jgi:hypothetical protein
MGFFIFEITRRLHETIPYNFVTKEKLYHPGDTVLAIRHCIAKPTEGME